jgi:hypothetical protein
VTTIKIVNPLSADLDAPTQSLLGLGALAAELAAQGVSVRDLFARTGVQPSHLEDHTLSDWLWPCQGELFITGTQALRGPVRA